MKLQTNQLQKKRYLSLALAIITAASAMTGCMTGGGTQTTAAQEGTENKAEAKEDKADVKGQAGSEKVELEFFNYKVEGEAVFNKVIEKFQAEYPNITVKQTAPTDAETVLFTRISTGDAPDVMSVYPAETAYHTMMDDGVYLDFPMKSGFTVLPTLPLASPSGMEITMQCHLR